MPIKPIITAAQGRTLSPHPVIETSPTNNELHMACRGYLLVGSYFERTIGLKNNMLTQEAADDTIVFMTILPG